MFFNYSKQAPYLNYGVVDKNQNLKHFVPIELPGPRLPHDMAFSKNYSIINDLPLFWDQEMLKKGVHATRLHDLPSRFAVIPRYGNPEDIQWFEADPTYVLHWNNAYEVGDELILEGYFQEHPWPENYIDAPPGLERMMAFLDFSLLKPRLHRWKFNLKTGVTSEEDIDDATIEFGVINQHVAGVEHRYTYSMIPTKGHFTFDGLTKFDHHSKSSSKYVFEDHVFISEVSFAPRTDSTDEDDGYLVTISNDVKEKSSACLLFDAKNIEHGPVCEIPLPHHICSGTHATWAQKNELTK
jgi:carotenoid cleavage dioxygenase